MPEAAAVVVKAAVAVKAVVSHEEEAAAPKGYTTMHTSVGFDSHGLADEASCDSVSILATVLTTCWSSVLPYGGLAAKFAAAMAVLLLLAVTASANHFINTISPHI